MITETPQRDKPQLAALMREFLDTTTYVGPIRHWQDVPETGTSEDEPQ
jgi:hypothetical protein